MSFKVGDSVKVKEGIMCPDDDSICIGGWQGRISDIEDDGIVEISWDSITLKQLPLEYIRHSEKEGLDWTEMHLSADEIESASPRDSEKTADSVREEMESKFFWLGEGEEGKRILTVIANSDDEIEAWNRYLTRILKFPFEAKVSEPQDRGPLQEGNNVHVQGIVEPDEHYGVLVDVACGQKHFVFPLCDLTVRDRKSPNYNPVKDHGVWFANK